MSKHTKNLPAGRSLAFLGAALVLAAPSIASARFCPVDFDVTSNESIGALQISTDYSGAGTNGDLVACGVLPSGLSDAVIDDGADTATLGYANASGFTGPAPFARCYFEVPADLDPDPVPGDFPVSVDDASDTDVPAGTISPTVEVSVGTCIASIGSCAVSPRIDCKSPSESGKSQIQLKDNIKDPADDSKDQGKFQWKKGAEVLLAEFGDPVGGSATHSWCVYDGGDLVSGSDVAGGIPGWKAAGSSGFQFKGDANGIAQIKLKAGAAGKSQVQVKAKSKAGNFSSPDLPLVEPVVSQLVIDDGVAPVCFTTTFSGTAKKNEDKQYKSKD